jgi:hypothetical protein
MKTEDIYKIPVMKTILDILSGKIDLSQNKINLSEPEKHEVVIGTIKDCSHLITLFILSNTDIPYKTTTEYKNNTTKKELFGELFWILLYEKFPDTPCDFIWTVCSNFQITAFEYTGDPAW